MRFWNPNYKFKTICHSTSIIGKLWHIRNLAASISAANVLLLHLWTDWLLSLISFFSFLYRRKRRKKGTKETKSKKVRRRRSQPASNSASQSKKEEERKMGWNISLILLNDRTNERTTAIAAITYILYPQHKDQSVECLAGWLPKIHSSSTTFPCSTTTRYTFKVEWVGWFFFFSL